MSKTELDAILEEYMRSCSIPSATLANIEGAWAREDWMYDMLSKQYQKQFGWTKRTWHKRYEDGRRKG